MVWASRLRFTQDNALPCKWRIEYCASYLSNKSGAVQELVKGMNRKTSLSVPLIWGLALLSSVPCAVADTSKERITRFKLFSNCSPMDIVIEDLSPDAKKIGLTKAAIQAAVESRLRSARLYKPGPLKPHIYVRVSVLRFAFSISLQFKKPLYDRFSDHTFEAPTWEKGFIGTLSGSQGYILSSISELMDRFLVEFLRVNEDACKKR